MGRSNSSKQVLSEALALSPVERAELVEQLLTSFEFSPRASIDKLWATEVEERIEAYERGELPTTPAKDVFEKISRK
jgi:putative addiction module component (TIGR02574 family)